MTKILYAFLISILANYSCVGAEKDERIPLMRSSNVVYAQQVHYQGNEPYLTESLISTKPLRELGAAEQLYMQGLEIKRINNSRSIEFFKKSSDMGYPLGTLEYARSLHSHYMPSWYGKSEFFTENCCGCLFFGCCPFCVVSNKDIREMNTKFEIVFSLYRKVQSAIEDPVLLVKIEEEVNYIKYLQRSYNRQQQCCSGSCSNEPDGYVPDPF